jgi:16S rRNA (guanine527-N7)-methyltransferase
MGASDADGWLGELLRGASALGLTLSGEQQQQFASYLDVLLFWRERLSLISTADPLAIVRAHILDCLRVVPLVPPRSRVVDLGSGAGFPGIPIAIALPNAQLTLVESKRKKANFLRAAVRRAGLSNVDVREGRAEDSDANERCDVAVSRAVWKIREFLQVSRGLLRPQGLAIAMKGPKALDEGRTSAATFSGPEIIQYTIWPAVPRLLLVYTRR